jgi:Calcineurin-like phosphoesterase
MSNKSILLKSITSISEALNIEPCDISYLDWKKMASVSELTAYTGLGLQFGKLKKALFPKKTVDLERVNLNLDASKNNKQFKQLEQQELYLARLDQTLSKHFKGIIKPAGYALKKPSIAKRQLNLLLSDHHYGSNLDPRELPYKYSFQEESRRLAKVVLETCEFKSQYRNQTDLNLVLGGDLLHGNLHDPRAALTDAEQFADGAWLLSQAISRFSSTFPRVRVFCTPGNHDRGAKYRNSGGRGIDEKWDSSATQLYFALKLASSHLKNVEFFIPRTPYVEYDVFGQNIFFTHGDTIFNGIYVAKSLNIKSIRDQINDINCSIFQRTGKRYSVFAAGHVHTGSSVELSNDVTFITNGALTPTDAFGLSIGAFSTNCEQQLWESVPGYAVGDRRPIKVGELEDKNCDLDKIIVPFSGEF